MCKNHVVFDGKFTISNFIFLIFNSIEHEVHNNKDNLLIHYKLHFNLLNNFNSNVKYESCQSTA